jgi:hypothetical protein
MFAFAMGLGTPATATTNRKTASKSSMSTSTRKARTTQNGAVKVTPKGLAMVSVVPREWAAQEERAPDPRVAPAQIPAPRSRSATTSAACSPPLRRVHRSIGHPQYHGFRMAAKNRRAIPDRQAELAYEI